MSHRGWLLTVLMAICAAFSFAQAQEADTPDQPPARQRLQRGDRRADRERGQRGQEFAERYRERMLENIREQSGATQEEWQAIEPKVAKVLDLQRELRPVPGLGMRGPGDREAGRPGGRGPGAGRGAGAARGPGRGRGAEAGSVARAMRDLRAALQDTSTSADDIRQKLTALREAREKTQQELEAARRELKASVNPRQEAVLVLAGILE